MENRRLGRISSNGWRGFTTSNLRLNIGSGQRPFSKPWVNVDIQERWNPDVVCDARSMPMFPRDSAEIIILHHVLEHVGCGELESALTECHRILIPGGSLIMCVPDMRALARKWIREEMDDETYMINVYGAFMGDEADRHRWGFTALTLTDDLFKVGELYT